MGRTALVTTKQTGRQMLCDILTGSIQRTAVVQAAIVAIIARYGLVTFDAVTFGLVNVNAANNNCSITSGAKELTSPDNPWSAGDVGKVIYVQGAGAAGVTLKTTIASYTAAGHVTLTDAASTTVAATISSTAGIAMWGLGAVDQLQRNPLLDTASRPLQSIVITDSDGDLVPAGPVTTSGLTENPDTLLGRSTTGVGPIEEIAVGSGLDLTAGVLTATGGGGESHPLGTVVAWAGPDVAPNPDSWLECDGSEISRTTYAELFALIGTLYGVGDGSTTFALPQTQRQVIMGRGGISTQSPGTATGDQGGEEEHVLTIDELAQHTHQYSVGPAGPDVGLLNPSGDSITINNTGVAGLDEAHNNIQPSLVLRYIIKATPGGAPPTPGPITLSGLTETTGTILGRQTAGTGAIEEITPGAQMIFTSGVINVKTQPSFRAVRASNQSLSSGSVVINNSEVFDLGGHYDPTTGLFVAPVAGNYYFHWSAGWVSGTVQINLEVNGAAVATSPSAVTGGPDVTTQSCLVALVPTDVVRLRATATGVMTGAGGGDGMSYFCGFKIL